ncbi:hypothetical protein SAMN05216582_12829 [Selenomonas ruminantium]|uniref:Uncharacterized protein n=2 Tax=Selenomonas ruminantium TaxID=971 RepID=A0A1M6WUE5_SELRU|nr:hypothetical protein SAMN05216582_12829 [Selenomonas ruminantium]
MTACRERGIKVYMLALGGKQTTPQANISISITQTMERMNFRIDTYGIGVKRYQDYQQNNVKTNNVKCIKENLMLHDSTIVKYSVDLENMLLKIMVEQDCEKKVLLFDNVLANWFWYILRGNAIYDISLMSIDSFFKYNKKILMDGKDDGWPFIYDTFEGFEKWIRTNEYNIYNIEGAYGVDGWIIAKGMNILGVDK